MNKKIILGTAIISGVVLILAAGYFIVNRQKSLPPLDPLTGFNFIFRYGVGGKNEINTFDQTYTKDMVIDPPIKIKFKLADGEPAEIYQKINDLNLFNKNPVLNTFSQMAPCSNYHLKIQTGSIQKELSWNDCRSEIRDEFRQFANYLINIIESKEEYKKLPTPKGGYL